MPPSAPAPDATPPGPAPGASSGEALRRFGLSFLIAAFGIGLFGLFRLSRQFPAATSSPGLLVPFLLPVLALAVEAGALVAVSASAVRLCSADAWRPMRARLRSLVLVAGPFLVALVLAMALPRGHEHPGAFANELVERARRSCDGDASLAVPVPLLGLTVRCDRGARIEGPMPGAPAIQLGMQSLTFSDDLRRVQMAGLELRAKRSVAVHLRAGSARIVGLAPWTRSPRLAPALRLATLLAIGLVLGVAITLLWKPAAGGQRPSRVEAWLHGALAALPGLTASVVVMALDQRHAEPAAYAVAAAAAVLVLLALAALRQRLLKMFNVFRGF